VQVNGIAELDGRQLVSILGGNFDMSAQIQRSLACHFIGKDGAHTCDCHALGFSKAGKVLALLIDDGSKAVMHMKVISRHAGKNFADLKEFP